MATKKTATKKKTAKKSTAKKKAPVLRGTPTLADLRRIARSIVTSTSVVDEKRMMALYSESIESEEVAGGNRPALGIEALKQKGEDWNKRVSDARWHARNLWCDGQTVIPEDLVVFEIHYQERIGENYFAKPAPGHGWWWYPHMTRDEGLLIKQWDSAGAMARSDGARADSSAGGEAPCTFSFHTAFKDPATPPDARDRKSIEVRCIVLYD